MGGRCLHLAGEFEAKGGRRNSVNFTPSVPLAQGTPPRPVSSSVSSTETLPDPAEAVPLRVTPEALRVMRENQRLSRLQRPPRPLVMFVPSRSFDK